MHLKAPFYARALCTYERGNHTQATCLAFTSGDLIRVTCMQDDGLYWAGVKVNNALAPVGDSGTFLHSYVEVVPIAPGMCVIATASYHGDLCQESEVTTLVLSPPCLSFHPKLQFSEGDTIYVHDFGVEEDGYQGVMMEGQLVDLEADEIVGERGWFPSGYTFIPFEVTAILDSWWGPQAYSDLFFSEGARIQVECVETNEQSYRGPKWRGRFIEHDTDRPLGKRGYFPSELVAMSTLLRDGNGLTHSKRLSGGQTPKARPAFPYRVTSKKEQITTEHCEAGYLEFPAEHPLVILGRASPGLFRGRLLDQETLKPDGEEGFVHLEAFWNEPW